MKSLWLVCIVLLFTNHLWAQELAVQTFGNKKDPALIFLHGGPGYNSVSFEELTAEELAAAGFFVISYDRRGEGRNESATAEYTFEQTLKDLQRLYKRFRLKKASLLGHSFGGVVATKFAEAYPKKVQALILIGAPIDFQATFKTIITRCKAIYQEKEDLVNLKYIELLEGMDAKSLPYSSYCFIHAMQNGFYQTKTPTPAAQALYQQFASNEALKKYASKMDQQSPQGFWKNERYTSFSLVEDLKNLHDKAYPIYGLYGKEDGLFDADHIGKLENIVGKEQVIQLEQCSHSVFIDRQAAFIQQLKTWLL